MDHRQGGGSLLPSSNLGGVLQPSSAHSGGGSHGGGSGTHGGDAALVWGLWGFAFMALVLEPLVYFGCLSADGVSVAADWRISHCPDGIVSAVWRTYAGWDPLFIRVPPFLRIMCSIEVFVFGPCYVACALALRPKLQQSPGGGHTSSPPKWLPGFALLFSGALLYSTALYFAYEVLFAPADFVNFPMVFLLNGPWVVLPVVLGRRALRAVREAQAGDRERFGALASPRGVVGCLNSDKWS